MFDLHILDSVWTTLETATRSQPLYGYCNDGAAVVVATTPRNGLVEVGAAVSAQGTLGEMADGTVEVLMEDGQLSARVSVEGVWAPAVLHRLSTRRDLQARNDGLVPHGRLAGATVAVVGLGSVGSQMARSLTQAGVGHFILIDPDTFSPVNVSRHVLDLASVGKPKVTAMADALRCVSPELTVTPLQLAAQHQTLAEVTAALAGCSLVIIATDSTGANRAAQLACIDAGQIPAVAVGCWDRAEAGEIIVSDTRRGTACYGCLRAALPTPITNRNAAEYMLESDRTPPNVGLGADVTFIAAVATKVCLALLTGDREPGLVEEDHSVLLVSTRAGGIFSSACQVAPIRAERDPNCWLCSHLHEEGGHV